MEITVDKIQDMLQKVMQEAVAVIDKERPQMQMSGLKDCEFDQALQEFCEDIRSSDPARFGKHYGIVLTAVDGKDGQMVAAGIVARTKMANSVFEALCRLVPGLKPNLAGQQPVPPHHIFANRLKGPEK